MTRLPDSVAANIRQWTRINREHTDPRAEDQWAAERIRIARLRAWPGPAHRGARS